MVKQILVNLVGFMQTHGGNVAKAEFWGGTEERLRGSSADVYRELLLSAGDSMRQSMGWKSWQEAMGIDRVGWSKTGVGFSAPKEMVGRMRISHASAPSPSGTEGRYPQRWPLRALQTLSVNSQKAPLLFDLPWVKYNYKAEVETDGEITAEEKDFVKAV